MVALLPDSVRKHVMDLLGKDDFVSAKEIYDKYKTQSLSPMWLVEDQPKVQKSSSQQQH